MASEQKKHTSKKEETEEVKATAAETDFDITDMLDDIDAVLEPNAEEFVAGYVQKGGQ